MGPSPTLARAGLRTPARAAWHSGVARALVGVAAAAPPLWLLGMLGFLVRGGLLLLLAPVVVLPSPVAVRMLLGDNLTSTGFAPSFYALVLVAAVAVVGVMLACLALAARVELAAHARLIGADEQTARRGTVASIFTVQLIALSALVAAGIPLAAGAASVAYRELLRPSLDGLLYGRVLGQLGSELFVLLAVLVVVEAASAVATRRLLAGAFGAGGVRSPLTAILVGLGRPARRPLTTLSTAVLGWLVTIALLLPALWAVGVAWDATRSALLGGQPGAVAGGTGGLIAVLTLVGAWLGALALGGVASAVRAALWTTEERR